MLCGFARKEITPDGPLRLAGIGGDRLGKTVLDPLYVRALALEDRNGRRAMLLVFDLLYVGTLLAETIYKAVDKSLGVPRDSVLTVATHTHSAPKTSEDFHEGNPVDVQYLEAVSVAAQHAAEKAISALRPASVSIALGADAPAINRRVAVPAWSRIIPRLRRVKVLNRPNFKADSDTVVTSYKLTFEDGRYLLIVNAALHAAVHRGEAYSADFPGYLFEQWRQRDPSDKCIDVLFLQGWAGDQSARLTTQLAPSLHPGRMVDYLVHPSIFARNAGRPELVTIADRICASLNHHPVSAPTDQDDLECRHDVLDAPLEGGGNRKIQLKSIKLSGMHVLAVSGEPFSSYRRTLELSGRPVMTVGYLDGPFGYLPDARALKEGGYEPDRSIVLFGQQARFAPAAVDRFKDATRRLFDRQVTSE